MTVTGPLRPLHPMFLSEWDRLDVEGSAELVQGIPVMSPSESFVNRCIADALCARIRSLPGIRVVQDMDILLDAHPQYPTVRCPDVVVVRDGAVGDVSRLAPSDVLMVVEIVSQTSVERDWVTKRQEYAAAGIASYLVVDRHQGCLALFEKTGDGHYPDPTGDGLSAMLQLAGHRLPLQLSDLLP